MDKFRVAFGKKFDDTSLMRMNHDVMRNVSSDDLLTMMNLMNTYGDDKVAMVISKEEA